MSSDSCGRECLSRQKFDAARHHFEKVLRAYESNVTATEFLGASFLALTSLMSGSTLFFDDAIVRFDRWLTDDARASLRLFHDAYKWENMVAVDDVVKSLKESDNELANAVEYYASVLHTKLQLRCVFILFTQARHWGIRHINGSRNLNK